jgi:predicted flap endonuclease-1-like 5' DNA nuclease
MIPLLGEIWFWTLLSFLTGLGIGWWIWHNSNLDRVSALEGELSMARRSADDAAAARTRVEKELAESNAKIMPLMTTNTSSTAEIERLKRELGTSRADDASDDAEIARLRKELEAARAAHANCEAEIARLRGTVSGHENELMGFRSQAAKLSEKLPLFLDAPRGVPDDLRLIKGVGDKLNAMLTGIGIYHFRQVASWTAGDIEQVDAKLEIFKGRIQRDDWVAQAKLLADGKHDEFERLYGKMGENN